MTGPVACLVSDSNSVPTEFVVEKGWTERK